MGTDPKPAGGTGIMVSLTTQTAPNVAIALTQAINSLFFALPDLRGLSLRGNDPTQVYDINSVFRGGLGNNNLYGANAGTYQPGGNERSSLYTAGNSAGGGVSFSQSGSSTLLLTAPGLSDVRPDNVSVNWIIKY